MLYVVSTPIGNMKDISLRALQILESCDIIACEDTRRTLKLLHYYKIRKPLVSYREHNREQAGELLLAKAGEGLNICLVSDAGTPGISDPGENLIQLFQKHGIQMTAIPGPCALINGLVLAGLPFKSFVFEGFLPARAPERRARLLKLAGEERTLVFYEAPHRIGKTLSDMAFTWGEARIVCLAREMTKIHEEVIRGTLRELASRYGQEPPKGEIVIIVEGNAQPQKKEPCQKPMEERYSELLQLGCSRQEAMSRVSKEYECPRREVYRTVHKL